MKLTTSQDEGRITTAFGLRRGEVTERNTPADKHPRNAR